MQVGAYPETIKDTLITASGVPDLFLVPEQMFDAYLGVSSAELEFPLYFNYYVKNRPLRFICRPHQLRAVWRVLKEALFGPSWLDHEREYAHGKDTPGFPDLATEMAYYKLDPKSPRGRKRLKEMVIPIVIEEHDRVEVDGVHLTCLPGDTYMLERNGEVQEVGFEPRPPSVWPEDNRELFTPPTFGVTIIGSGHGFDTNSNTSGFIIWFNGRGVLVDPPVESTEWMRAHGIDRRLIGDVILTHTHADHDAGTLQKILEEGRIRLHTTQTVLRSFLRKYRSLTGLPGGWLYKMFDFKPVLIGQPINICAGEFLFKYNLHPIPTLGFECTYGGGSFAYSCDTLYDPELYEVLQQDGILNEARKKDLLNFNWQADLIIHEAGIPPIHTPMSVLAGLPDDVKSRIYLTHVSQTAIPPDSGLRLAPPGPAQTLVIPVDGVERGAAEQRLDLLAHIDLFRDMSISKAAELLRISRPSLHAAGDYIVRAGESAERFYVVEYGEVDVFHDGVWRARYGRYDYFGEIGIVLDQPRNADVIARTDSKLLTISRADFLSFVHDTSLLRTLRRVASNKLSDSWEVLKDSRHLNSLSAFQKTQLLADMEPVTIPAGEILFKAGERVKAFYLVAGGEIEVEGPGTHRAVLGRGALLGQLHPDSGTLCRYSSTAVTVSEVNGYRISSQGIDNFFKVNPGSYVRLVRLLNPSTPSYLA